MLLVIKMNAGASVKREIQADTLNDVLDASSELADMCVQKFDKVPIQFQILHQNKKKVKRQPLKIHNICGKISHHGDIWQPGVRSCLRKVCNAFGRFVALYSCKTNLLMSSAESNTLFRGGNNTTEIKQIIDIALKTEKIYDISIHMLVGNAFLDHSVSIQSTLLTHTFDQANDWKFKIDEGLEDQTYQKTIRLSEFSQALCDHLIPNQTPPLSLLMNISRNGNVNLFLGLAPDTEFKIGLEDKFLPFLRYFMIQLNACV